MSNLRAAAQATSDPDATQSRTEHSHDSVTTIESTAALNEVNVEKIGGFLGRWKPGGAAHSDCVSDAELIEIAKLTDRDSWPKHVQNCDRCENVILLLNRADMRIPIDVFLSRTSREVRQAKAKQSFSSYVWAFYNVSAPRYALVYLAVFLFLGVAGIWIYQKRSETVPPYAASLKEDDYWKITEWIRARTAVADESSLSPDQRLAKLRELQGDYGVVEGKLIAIQQSNTLGSSEKAELAQLVTTYNSQIKVLTSRSETKAVSNGADPVLVIQANTDSDIVSKVSASILSSKSDQLNQKEKDLETAKAVVQASKELDFTSINNKEVEVQDLVPNRSAGERKAIQDRLTDLKNTDGITVKFNEVAPNYRDASSPLLRDTAKPIETSAKSRKE